MTTYSILVLAVGCPAFEILQNSFNLEKDAAIDIEENITSSYLRKVIAFSHSSLCSAIAVL
jgi:hypothetical protein